MQIFKSIDELSIEDELVVALGTFDGVHIGHLEILQDAISEARKHGYKSACYTFSNHPMNFLRRLEYTDEGSVRLLCSEEQKLEILENLGFDYVINVPFDATTMNMRALDFIDDILYEKLHAKIVCCGFNYSFGVRAEGNVEILTEEGQKLGMQVRAHDAVKYDGKIVSSTAVRSLVREGNFELANKYLGRGYSVTGKVVHGNRIGRDIGYPTMNLTIPPELEMPPCGVYFSKVEVDGVEYKSITNIGYRPTVGTKEKFLEAHLFDFDSEVYGDSITIMLLKFHRPEIRFDNFEQLSRQISLDCELAYNYEEHLAD